MKPAITIINETGLALEFVGTIPEAPHPTTTPSEPGDTTVFFEGLSEAQTVRIRLASLSKPEDGA